MPTRYHCSSYKEDIFNRIARNESSSVAAVQSCFCFIIVAAAIVLRIGALFLLFVLLYSQRVASQSCETLGELLHHPTIVQNSLSFTDIYLFFYYRKLFL